VATGVLRCCLRAITLYGPTNRTAVGRFAAIAQQLDSPDSRQERTGDVSISLTAGTPVYVDILR